MNDYNIYLKKLQSSQFRSKFKLNNQEIEYINKIGWDKLISHTCDFISKRLVPNNLANDGKQTPMRGHPVFIAQHATATCCRGCLSKWYNIPKDRPLKNQEVDFIVNIILKWIENQIKN